MVKKVTSLALAGMLMISTPAFAEVGDENVMLIAAPSYYSSVLKNYVEISEVGEDYIICEVDEQQKIQLNIFNDTILIDSELALPIKVSDLKAGDSVFVEYSPNMTKSIPAQSNAKLIVSNIEKGGNVELITANEVKTDENGNVIVTDNANDIIVTISKDAQVKAYMSKDIKTLGDITVGTELLAWYDMATLSLPAQAGTQKVVIVSSNESEVEDNAGELTVTANGKEVVFTDCEPFYQDGTLMLPLNKVGEALGYVSKWNEETRAITIENSVTKATLFAGSNKVTFEGEMNNVVENSQDTVIVNSRTFVPAEFFEEFGNTVEINGMKVVIEK